MDIAVLCNMDTGLKKCWFPNGYVTQGWPSNLLCFIVVKLIGLILRLNLISSQIENTLVVIRCLFCLITG